MITSNDIGSLTIPVILMISSYIYFIIDYNKYKNYNRIFTHSIVPILVITYTMYSGLAHILLQDRVSSSIGWASGGFQVLILKQIKCNKIIGDKICKSYVNIH